MAGLLPLAVSTSHVSPKTILGLITMRALSARRIHEGAWICFGLQMNSFDVCVKSFLLAESFITGWILSTVELGVMDLFVALQSTVRCEGLAATLPITRMVSLGHRVKVCQVSLKMVFTRESAVAVVVRAGKRALFGMGTHVRFESAGSIEALSATLKVAHIIPRSLSLAVRTLSAIVCVIDLSICRGIELHARAGFDLGSIDRVAASGL